MQYQLKNTHIDKLPEWVIDEIQNPAREGGRNNQMFRIAIQLAEVGCSEEEMFNLFRSMYEGDVFNEEIQSTIGSACQYSPQKRERFNKEIRQRHRAFSKLAAKALPEILKNFATTVDEIASQSPLSIPELGEEQTKLFLRTMFCPGDNIWIGKRHHSGGPQHDKNFCLVQDWIQAVSFPGPLVSHSTFFPCSISRSNDCVSQQKFMVVESDELSLNETSSVFKWLNAEGGLNLRAIVFSGNKSLHGWFDFPQEEEALPYWRAILKGFRCDTSPLAPSHPVRLPGVVRGETGHIQTLIFLKGE